MDGRPFHAESRGQIAAPAERVFAHLDDHSRLSAHMARRSWRMGWGRMDLRLDERAGRAVGSHIRLDGRAFGVHLALDEVVTVTVFVDYALPDRGASRLLGRLFGHAYAQWCCTRMVEDARAGLASAPAAAGTSGRRVLGT